jgi:hypothetical protein
MRTYTEGNKASRKLKVGFRLGGSDQATTSRVLEVGLEGGLIKADTCVRCGQRVQLIFDEQTGEKVCVDCIVEPFSTGTHKLRYCSPKVDFSDRLNSIIWPDWDGANLLDGALLIAERDEVASLSDLLRVTSLLSTIQHKAKCRRQVSASSFH